VGYSKRSYSAQVSSISSDRLSESEDVGLINGRYARVYGSNGGGVVEGILYKWVNYGKGWRLRWFVLEDGVLSYYKLHGPDKIVMSPRREKVVNSKLIGEDSAKYMRKNSWGDTDSNGGHSNSNSTNRFGSSSSKQWKPFGEVHLKV